MLPSFLILIQFIFSLLKCPGSSYESSTLGLFQSCGIPWRNKDILMVASVCCALPPSHMKGLIKLAGVTQRVSGLCPGCICRPLAQPLLLWVQLVVLESYGSVPGLPRHSLPQASYARPGSPDSYQLFQAKSWLHYMDKRSLGVSRFHYLTASLGLLFVTSTGYASEGNQVWKKSL